MSNLIPRGCCLGPLNPLQAWAGGKSGEAPMFPSLQQFVVCAGAVVLVASGLSSGLQAQTTSVPGGKCNKAVNAAARAPVVNQPAPQAVNVTTRVQAAN